jgi:hypothetical protein
MLLAPAASEEGRAASWAAEVSEPKSVIQAYFQALYARDFATAYRYVSAQDQRARSLNEYLRAQRPLHGFALQVSRALAAMIEIEVVSSKAAGTRQLLTLRYTAPDPEKIAPLLYHWNGYQLNSLSAAQRHKLLEAIASQQRRREIAMITGEEKLTLVNESEGWRVLLDWSRGLTIPLRTVLGRLDAVLDVELSPDHVTTQPGGVFNVALRIINRGEKPAIIRISHIVQPQELANHLEIVQCGFLQPIRIEAGAIQEYSGTYLLSGSLPAHAKELLLEFGFSPLSD